MVFLIVLNRMHSILNIRVVIGLLFSHAVCIRAFDVYWNVPTQQCKRDKEYDIKSVLSTYGILVNEEDKFQGENITIFYEEQLGLYPHKNEKTDQYVNGGIPQRGNLSDHLDKARKDIERIIPNRNFNGLGVIDWESWRPVWNFNWGNLRHYQDKAREYIKEQYPSLSDKELNEKAQEQWEDSARSYMLETILLSKKLRPNARWCYYLFPDCYNHEGKKPDDFQCSTAVRSGNDKLRWLWQSSSALCPSVYLYAKHLEKTFQERAWKDQAKLKEALRVASSETKLYPYVNYYLDGEMVPQEEFRRMVAQIAAVGGDGLVIWGSSASVKTSSLCNELKAYVIDTIGPTVARVARNSDLCRKNICHGRGRCTWPNDEYAVVWKLFLRDNSSGFKSSDIVCRCEENFAGRYCEDEVYESII